MLFILGKIWGFINKIYYRGEYALEAYICFAFLKIKGTNYLKRTKNRSDIEDLKRKVAQNSTKRAAIFVAFHSPNKIPQSNLNYINILNKCSFNIIYIINGKLSRETLEQLNKMGCYVICRENIGQDFGAYKDGIALLKKYKITDHLKWLVLCNDSNFCLGGKNSDNFIKRFSEALNSKEKTDFISLNCNFESRLHYQSYFLCLSNLIFQNKSFDNFWRQYIPLNNRYHAIISGEKKFTTKILRKFNPKTLFTSHELSGTILLNKEDDYNLVLKNLPKSLFFLVSAYENNLKNKNNNQFSILQLLISLESYNPSHVYGLLSIIYLNSPFLKKDVMRQGVFSYTQIYEMLKLEKLDIEENLINEIMDLLMKGGTAYSYMESMRTAFRRGISVAGGAYEYQSETKILRKNFKK